MCQPYIESTSVLSDKKIKSCSLHNSIDQSSKQAQVRVPMR